MDAKIPGDMIYILGLTRNEMGASEYYEHMGYTGLNVPRVRTEEFIHIYKGLQNAIEQGLTASVHGIYRGGLGNHLAMTAMGGNIGMIIDLDENRLNIAKDLGAEIIINPTKEDTVKTIESWSGGYGADCVLFTAATNSSEPLSQAFKMTKKKGKVVLVGVSGMEINRADIYAKELDFLISTSYGPGRYDKFYEEKGCDYPYAYVRWTENRNMTEYLRLLDIGAIRLDKLINGVYPIEKVTQAFESLKESQKPLMVLLDYGKVELDKIDEYLNHDRKVTLATSPHEKKIL
jgi:threonine dehydrogenase-like Zn-dependent dehydrogenase